MVAEKTNILTPAQVQQKINRIAHQLYEAHTDDKSIVIVGVASRGYVVAQRLAKVLTEISGIKIELVALTINKDEVHKEIKLSAPIESLAGQSVVLVDDVLNSGKVLMYAARHLLSIDLKKLSTVVLVDRRHRSFPIRADYVGLTLSTTLQEHITVDISVNGKNDAIYLE